MYENETQQHHEEERACCNLCTKRTCCITSLLSFIIILIGGIFMLALIPYLIHETIKHDITLRLPDSGLYQTFRNNTNQSVHVKNVYHFFHLKNRPDVEKHGAVPEFESRGPYVYLHVKVRPEEHIMWHPNGTMSYRDIIHNYFLADESQGNKESDVLCTPKMGVFMAMQESSGDHGRYEDAVRRAMADATPTFDSFFQEISVFDMIHGYDEPVLVALKKELAHFKSIDPQVAFDPNQTTPGPKQAIYSGAASSKTQPAIPDGYKSFAQYTMVNGESQLDYWNSTEANRIRGTDATMYPALYLLDTSRVLEAYVSDIKRSVNLAYTNHHREHGLPVQRYRLQDTMFESKEQVPANGDYFIYHQGLQPVTPVKGVDPEYIFAAISKPYYLDVTDMTDINVSLPRKPNRDLDDVILDYEPLTSTLVEGHERLQLNVKIGPVALFSVAEQKRVVVDCSKNLPKTWVPIFSFDKTAVLPEKDRNKLKKVLELLVAMLVVGILFVVAGTLGAIAATYKLCTMPIGEEAYADDDNKRLVSGTMYGAVNTSSMSNQHQV